VHTIKTVLTGSSTSYGAVNLELLELSTDERLEVAVLGTVRPMGTDALDVVFVGIDGNTVSTLADEGFEHQLPVLAMAANEIMCAREVVHELR
jgi:hypothetical protein